MQAGAFSDGTKKDLDGKITHKGHSDTLDDLEGGAGGNQSHTRVLSQYGLMWRGNTITMMKSTMRDGMRPVEAQVKAQKKRKAARDRGGQLYCGDRGGISEYLEGTEGLKRMKTADVRKRRTTAAVTADNTHKLTRYRGSTARVTTGQRTVATRETQEPTSEE